MYLYHMQLANHVLRNAETWVEVPESLLSVLIA